MLFGDAAVLLGDAALSGADGRVLLGDAKVLLDDEALSGGHALVLLGHEALTAGGVGCGRVAGGSGPHGSRVIWYRSCSS